MSDSIAIEDLAEWLERGAWEQVFDLASVAAGRKLAGARQVGRVTAELLESGDAELGGQVTEKTGEERTPVIAVWREGTSLVLEGDCSCPLKVNCSHSAAILVYLAKSGERVERAFGGTPHQDLMSEGQTLSLEAEEGPKCVGRWQDRAFKRGRDRGFELSLRDEFTSRSGRAASVAQKT